MVRGRLVYGGRRLTDRNHRLKYGSMFGIIKKTWGFIPKSFRESVRILAFVIWAVQGSKHVIFAVKAGQGGDFHTIGQTIYMFIQLILTQHLYKSR